jgi:hypothetical protein
MPRGDGTGPAGLGPMTGRAAGYCAGYAVPGYTNPIAGRGFGWFGGGRGRAFFGRGRGYRNMYYATGLPGWARSNIGVYNPDLAYTPPTMAAAQEAELLKNQAKLMQDDLKALNERIQELEKMEAETKEPKK